MNKKKRLLILAVIVLILCASIAPTYSYFTTYARALGGREISLGTWTEIEESFSDWTKHVQIVAKEKSSPVFVRVKAFSGDNYALTFSGSGWTQQDDGYWYWNQVLEANKATDILDIAIHDVPTKDAKSGDEVNVAVVYECVLALYDEDGEADMDLSWEAGSEHVKILGGGTDNA